jgi:tryptophan synthase beta chain
VPEALMPLILELELAYAEARKDSAFQQEMAGYLTNYVGRPSPLYFAERMTEHLKGAKIYFKRDELNHTGAHKINNVLGQIMIARRMGKRRIIAETGAGMHGVATATLCARFGLECIVYMGSVDVERQEANVLRMKMLGADVRAVQSGSRTLKDAMNEALRDWVTNVEDTFYCIGTVAGPHPYPVMVRDFQCIIGKETRDQMVQAEGRLPNSLIACIGGGSNAIGLFHPFLDEAEVEMYGVEAAGRGLDSGAPLRLLKDDRGSFTATVRSSSWMTMDRLRMCIRYLLASIIPVSVPNTRGSTRWVACSTSLQQIRKHYRLCNFAQDWKASFRRWSPRMRLRRRSTLHPRSRNTI